MRVHINGDSSVPVFQQIVDQVKAAVARGACLSGEMIPSVRQMAAQALVNPNTVAKAYRELEREGIVSTQRGLGVVVSEDARRQCEHDRRQAMRESLTATVLEAQRAGISGEELQSDLERLLNSSPNQDGEALAGPHGRTTASSRGTPKSDAAADG